MRCVCIAELRNDLATRAAVVKPSSWNINKRLLPACAGKGLAQSVLLLLKDKELLFRRGSERVGGG
jgi:hypothetical protein